MSYKTVQRRIAKGKGLLIFSIIFSVLARGLYLYLSDGEYQQQSYPDSGYLWAIMAPLFSDQIYSVLAATLSVALLALLLNYIDVRNIILREKSSLVPAFVILLFSSHTAFFEMSPYLIASLLFLSAIAQLFSAYHSTSGAISCLNISFALALGSLFQPVLLLYYAVFLFGFSAMQILSFKSILATLLGLIFVYSPLYCISLATGSEELFFLPLDTLNVENLLQLPVQSFGYGELVLAGFIVFVFGWLCVHNYMTSYKDKIRTRVFIFFLGLVQLIAVVAFLSFNYGYLMNIYIGLVMGSILLAHYFTLTDQRIMISLFFILLIICFITCYTSFPWV